MENQENRRKHLEFVQNVITRMNTNSFQIKGWVIALVSALLALAAANIPQSTSKVMVFVSILPIFPFWILDGFFISKERKFRKLYKKLISSTETTPLFSMNINEFNSKSTRWVYGVFSKTLVIFYLALLVATTGMAILLICVDTPIVK